MAYFAELNSSNVVIRVIAVGNADNLNSSGQEDESFGIAFCKKLYGSDTTWKQTSYNTRGNVHSLGGTPLRKNYAGAGMTYDSARDAFISPRPFASWTLNENTCLWECPITYPNDGKLYTWNETAYQADNSVGWDEAT
tara:strand:- start:48 stop:461 length:414 start_codon:yes stop_codon:yes gene_type:complete